MGVELEWESGSTAHDDLPPFPNHSRRKWPWVAAFAIVLIVAIVYAAIRIRLQQIDEWQQRTLRDVVIAEVTALRIGDENAFLEFQHGGDEVWLAQQRDYFVAVQGAADLQLSGNILESEITSDGLLGVVRLMEIENAVPYERLWFYWNFADLGWRHLPQNPDLWGDAATNSSDHLRIDYYARDKALAKQLADTLPRWLQIGCEAMACATLPSWHVEILPDPNLNLSWEALAPWNLRIPSPYLTRSRSDMPFSPELRSVIASLLSDRLLSSSTLAIVDTQEEEALYLKQAISAWLWGALLGRNDASPLLHSIADRYGVAAIGELVQLRQEQALLPAIRQVTRAGLVDLSRLDWRDYLEWQLARGDPNFAGKITTLSAIADADSTQLIATLRYEEEGELAPAQIRFALVDDRWQRLPD